MAAYYLIMENEAEFFRKLKNRDIDLISKMVKNVLNAIERRKSKTDIFEITFKNKDVLVFSIEKSQYNDMLKRCLNDLIIAEDYMTCAKICKIINKQKTKEKIMGGDA